jgi:hypothetical protein
MQATAPSLQDCVCFSRPLAKQRKGSRLLSPQIPQRITGQRCWRSSLGQTCMAAYRERLLLQSVRRDWIWPFVMWGSAWDGITLSPHSLCEPIFFF